MASTAPSSGARSTPWEPRWCPATGPPCCRTPPGSSRECSRSSLRPGIIDQPRDLHLHGRRDRNALRAGPRGAGPGGRRGAHPRRRIRELARRALDGAREGGRAGPRLQAPPDLLHRHDRKPHAPPHPDGRRTHRVLRRRRARRPLEGMARDHDRGGGAGRRPPAAGLRPGLGAYDGRGPQRRSPVPGDRAGGRHGGAGDRRLARRFHLDVEARSLHGDPGLADAHLDRERVFRAGPADPPGPRGRGQTRRRREDHRAGREDRQPQRARRLPVPLRRAPRGRHRRSTSTGRP